MEEIKTIRASRMNILAHCRGMLTDPKAMSINTRSAVADAGTLVHSEVARFIVSGEPPNTSGFSQSEHIPISIGWDMWHRSIGTIGDKEFPPLSHYIPDPIVEQALSLEYGGMIITGHPDLYGVSEETLYVVDWKAGYIERDYLPQLITYAALIMLTNPEIKISNVMLVTGYLREAKDNRFKSAMLSSGQVISMFKGYIRTIRDYQGDEFTTGDHCQYCPLKTAGCDAFNAELSTALANFDQTGEMVVENPITFYRQLGEIEKQAHIIKQSFKDRLLLGLPIVEGDQEMYLTKPSDKVNSDSAILALQEEYSAGDILANCKISKSGITALAKSHAPRGEKGSAAEELLNTLMEKGIITPGETGTIRTRKIKS